MIRDSRRKRVAVLSDHELSFRAIALGLTIHFSTEIIRLDARQPVDDLDLIIVALGSPDNEPLVELARASLGKKIGQVPVLISSDKPFRHAPDVKIFRLDSPFDLDRLGEQVRYILNEEYRDNGNR